MGVFTNLADRYEERGNPDSIFTKLDYTPTPRQALFHAATEYDVLFGGAAGGGKMLRCDEPVPTPGGWSTIGALTPGDTLFTETGDTCTVTAVHPVDLRPAAYAITFDDGTRIEACADHLWFTYTAADLASLTRRDPQWRAARRATRPRRGTGARPDLAERNTRQARTTNRNYGAVRTTKEIAETVRLASGRTNHAVPVAAALNLPHANLPLDPYVLGAWLGDGSTSTGWGFTSADPEVLDEFRAAGWTAVHTSATYGWRIGDTIWAPRADNRMGRVNTFTTALRGLGVLNNKHIPTAYLRASAPQRLALLQGLMDTDGHACDSGAVEFTSTSPALAEGVRELVVSLGWKASIREGRATINGRDCGPKYRIKWTADQPVFRLARKLARQNTTRPARRTRRFRYIVSVEPCPPSPMRCITVNNPTGLFLASPAMVPTHNTKALLLHALRECVRYPGLRVGAFRRTYDELRESLLKELAMVGFGEALGCSWNGTERELRFPNGAVIRFRYLETLQDATRRQGGEYQLVLLDERTLIPPDAVSLVVDERIRSGRADIPVLGVRSGTNPGGPGHGDVKARYIDATEHGAKVYTDPQGRTVRFIQSKVSDNPHLDAGYVARLDGIPDPNRRAAMRDGDWDSFAGMAFPEWRTDDLTVPPFPIPDEWVRYVGIDYGYAAPWFTVFVARDPDGRMWVYDELTATQVTEREQARRILAAEAAHGGDPTTRAVVRAADPSMWAKGGSALPVAHQYAVEGVALEKANNDRLTGKARVHTYLRAAPACSYHRGLGQDVCPMLHITNAPNLITGMASLPTDPRRPEDVDTAANDHCYDSLRYALMHVGAAPSFVFGDETDPASHRPQGEWVERLDPNVPDFTADRDPRSGGTATSPYA